MADETWKYVGGEITPDQYSSEPYTFVARISDIDNEVARFYRSYVMECGIDESKYVVRYQDLIKADPDVLTVIVDKFLFHIIAAIVSLIVMLNVGSKLRRERKALVYCAERYIVALGGRRMIIPYSDILWTYHKINYQNGVENNNEIVILDKENGAYSLPSLKSGAESKQIIGRVFEIIKSKNPGTRIGYTQDNIKAAAGTSV